MVVPALVTSIATIPPLAAPLSKGFVLAASYRDTRKVVPGAMPVGVSSAGPLNVTTNEMLVPNVIP